MAGSEAAGMAFGVYERRRERRLSVPPRDVRREIVEPDARGVVDRCGRQRVAGLRDQPLDLGLDLFERARAGEQLPELTDLVRRECGVAEAAEELVVGGLGP